MEEAPVDPPLIIPAHILGDLLEIYSFFKHFDDIIENGPIFQLEELYSGLLYQGPEFLHFINDLHLLIVELFVNAVEPNILLYENLNKTNTSLFLLMQQSMLKDKIKQAVMRASWPALFAEQLRVLHPPEEMKPQTLQIVGLLEALDINHYNQLPLETKISILLLMVNSCMELQVVREIHQKINERVLKLTKEKVDLTERLKTARKTHKEAMEKLKPLKEQGVKVEGEEADQNSAKNAAEKQRQVSKLEKEAERAQNKAHEIEEKIIKIKRELLVCVHTADFLGRDRQQFSYWVFGFDQDRVYRCSPDNKLWTFSRRPIRELVACLDTKDSVLENLRARIQIYERKEQTEAKSPLSFAQYVAEISNYQSTYDQKQGNKRSKDGDVKYSELLAFL